jgi:site-specific recombinase XerD
MPDLVSLATGQLATPEDYARQSLAPETLRAYRGAWRCFEQWCQGQNLRALPALPETVARYLVSMAPTHARATLTKRVSAIGQYHQLAGHAFSSPGPDHPAHPAGHLRRHGKPAVRSAALTTAEVRAWWRPAAPAGRDVRDRRFSCWAMPGPCGGPSWSRCSGST